MYAIISTSRSIVKRNRIWTYTCYSNTILDRYDSAAFRVYSGTLNKAVLLSVSVCVYKALGFVQRKTALLLCPSGENPASCFNQFMNFNERRAKSENVLFVRTMFTQLVIAAS